MISAGRKEVQSDVYHFIQTVAESLKKKNIQARDSFLDSWAISDSWNGSGSIYQKCARVRLIKLIGFGCGTERVGKTEGPE